MRRIEEVIRDITTILEEEKVDYVIVGGIAVVAWGNIRTTRAIDIILFIKEKKVNELEEALRKKKGSKFSGVYVLRHLTRGYHCEQTAMWKRAG
jgi:histone acetyltransferase (RNA polymerase elongator complex component)